MISKEQFALFSLSWWISVKIPFFFFAFFFFFFSFVFFDLILFPLQKTLPLFYLPNRIIVLCVSLFPLQLSRFRRPRFGGEISRLSRVHPSVGGKHKFFHGSFKMSVKLRISVLRSCFFSFTWKRDWDIFSRWGATLK